MEYTHFLFETGDGEKWLIATPDAVAGETYDNQPRPIVASSNSCSAYEAIWFNRADNPEDPWLSVLNHWDDSRKSVIYGENNSTHNIDALVNHNGGNVWVGKVRR